MKKIISGKKYDTETAERQLAMEMTEPVPAPPEANVER